jgi:hypothetical protein
MNENSKAPTSASTSPLGNTDPPPSPLARIISPAAASHLADFGAAADAVYSMIERKRRGGDGHVRG